MLLLSLALVTAVSSAVTPVQANFILGMDIQGQRLNLYKGCKEGNVTCSDMLLVAPDLGRLLQTKQLGEKLDGAPYSVNLSPAKTKYSLCNDGITPCQFQDYRFEEEDLNGFIDPSNHELYLSSNWTTDNDTFTCTENTTYLPLVSQTALIDDSYNISDQTLNSSYGVAQREA